MDLSTIAAIATPAGSGGVGIIKISGPHALKTVAAIFCPGAYSKIAKPAPINDPSFFSPWKIYYGHIANPETNRVYDEVVVAVMPAPHSYTREDVVEIQAHGGKIILENILGLLFEKGIRMAYPGEFTRRAFLNGRIDLAQAEAVIDLINARSEAAVEIAIEQAAGSLSDSIDSILSRITNVLSIIEARVDFPDALEEEEEGDGNDASMLSNTLAQHVLAPILELISTYDENKTLIEGFRVVIAGAPNVGKSSIMNRLSGSERAIVTDQPGTTRDFIEATLRSGEIPITLVDTAGLRIDPDPIEKIGIQIARKHIDQADLVLFVIDASEIISMEDLSFFAGLEGKQVFFVLNKIDLIKPDHKYELPEQMSNMQIIKISAKHNTGLDLLKRSIVETARNRYACKPENPVPNYRHKALLLEAHDALCCAIDNLKDHGSYELASIDLRLAHNRLGEITGKILVPDVLEEIFSRYCIGK